MQSSPTKPSNWLKAAKGQMATNSWSPIGSGMYSMPTTAPVRKKILSELLDAQMDELKEKYEGIYLVRNERHFKIYSFDDGQAFEPDFVLFLREKNGNTLIRQIFIEPKGKYLQAHEKWKEEFLKQIKEKFSGKVLVLEFQTEKTQTDWCAVL